MLDYYSGFCQKIVIYDNESDDNSPLIIKSYLNSEVRTYLSNCEIRDDLYVNIKNNVWKESRGKADWVIVCDTDEILYHPHIMEKLDELKARGVTIIKPYGYDMYSETLPQKSIFEIKHGIQDNRHFGKCIIFDPNLIEEINFNPGCHKCKPKGKVKLYNSNDIKLLHYKHLNLEYLLDRYDSFRKRLSKQNIENRQGKQYLIEKEELILLFNNNLKKSKKVID